MKVRFDGEPELKPLRGPKLAFRLLVPWRVLIDGITVIVPAGFVTDFASIPRVLQGALILNDDPDILLAAIVHDFLYSCGGFTENFGSWTRAQCDEILRDGMDELGAPLWKRWAVWSAVRAAGWQFFKGRVALHWQRGRALGLTRGRGYATRRRDEIHV